MKLKLRRLFNYKSLILRRKRMRVLSDIKEKRNILARFIELAALKYPCLYNVYPTGNIVFEINISDYDNNSDFKEYEKDLRTLCELWGYNLTAGYSGFDTPSYFFCMMASGCMYWIYNTCMFDTHRYEEFLDEYIKKYLK